MSRRAALRRAGVFRLTRSARFVRRRAIHVVGYVEGAGRRCGARQRGTRIAWRQGHPRGHEDRTRAARGDAAVARRPEREAPRSRTPRNERDGDAGVHTQGWMWRLGGDVEALRRRCEGARRDEESRGCGRSAAMWRRSDVDAEALGATSRRTDAVPLRRGPSIPSRLDTENALSLMHRTRWGTLQALEDFGLVESRSPCVPLRAHGAPTAT